MDAHEALNLLQHPRTELYSSFPDRDGIVTCKFTMTEKGVRCLPMRPHSSESFLSDQEFLTNWRNQDFRKELFE